MLFHNFSIQIVAEIRLLFGNVSSLLSHLKLIHEDHEEFYHDNSDIWNKNSYFLDRSAGKMSIHLMTNKFFGQTSGLYML